MAVSTFSSMLGGTILLLLLSLATDVHGGPSSSDAPRSPLDDLCISLGSWYVTPDLCVSTLCVDPSCRSARGLPELAVLATRLTVANATVAKASIKSALTHAKDAKARKVFQSCLQLYVSGVVPPLQWVARSVAAGRYSSVSEKLQAAMDASYGCTILVGDEVVLPKEKEEFYMMAYVVQAVIEWVQHVIG